MHRSFHLLERVLGTTLAVGLLLSLTFSPALADSGPPWLDTTLDDLYYTEQQGWTPLDNDVTVTSNTDDFSEGYVEVAVAGGTAEDALRLIDGGLLTVIGNAVYWDGDRIGTIDNTYDGTNGRLRINFSAVAPLFNADFETGNLNGWTVDANYPGVNGQAWVESPGDDPDVPSGNVDSDPLVDDPCYVGCGYGAVAQSASVQSSVVFEKSYALQLTITGTVLEGYGTAHGPTVTSEGFTASAGDQISLNWNAAQGGDWYDVYGFVYSDADNDGIWDTGESYQKLFHDVGANTGGWITTTTAVSGAVAGDNIRFIFINGNYDRSGGTAIGSSLYIDGIELQLSNVTVANNAILAAIIEHIEYQNTSDDPPATKDYRIDFEESDNSTGFNTAQIHFTAVNDDPTDIDLSNDTVDENQPAGTAVGTLTATDPDSGDSHTFNLVAGAGDSGNVYFSIAGGTLQTAAMFDYETQTSYSIRVQTSDGNGGTYEEVFTIFVQDLDDDPPDVDSISRADASPTGAASVDYTVIFDESVTGVDTGDFTLTTSGVSGATIAGVSGSGTTYAVTVNTGSGSGTIRLDLVDDDSIGDLAGNPLGGSGTGDGDFVGEEYVIDKDGPLVSSIVRADASPTNASSVDFTVQFNQDVTGVDASDFALTMSGITGASVTGISGSGDTYTITVDTGSGSGTLRLDVVDDDTIIDSVSNPLGGAGIGNGDFTSGQSYSIDRGDPTVLLAVNVAPGGSTTLVDRPSRLQIEFSEDVLHDGSTEAANNPANYLLVQKGGNGVYDTADCAGEALGNTGDDTFVAVGPASYANGGGAGPFVTTLQVNGGSRLRKGEYRLFVCGTASIEDLTGNVLNGGVSDSIVTFTVVGAGALPATGFTPGQRTVLPSQPDELAYASMGGMWLEIPSLGVFRPIVGVPASGDAWDLTWLGQAVGYLDGTAYPTWPGNTALTAHVVDSNGLPGPFADLNRIAWGDKIVIHEDGVRYVYDVRTVSNWTLPTDTRLVTRHEDFDWLTLITCQGFDDSSQTYRWRTVVRAILVSVAPESDSRR